MTRHRLLIALMALIGVVVAAVIYLETSNSSSAAATTTTSTTSTSATTSTLLPTTEAPTTEAPTTVTPITEAPTTVTPITEAATTVTPTTLPATTLPATTLPPPERSLVPVVVSSGPSNGTRLAPQAFLLGTVGWSDIRPLNGSVAFTQTTVFFTEGLQAAAELLAVDAGLPVTSIAPMADAPPVAGLADAQLLFYFGGA